MTLGRRHFLAMSAAALAAALWLGAARADTPEATFNFTLLIDGEDAGRFVEASGLSVAVDPIEYREGGTGDAIRHLPGQIQYQPLELRYGVSRSPALWTWLSGTLTGEPDHRTISVVMVAADGQTEAFRWTLYDAWVSSWQAAQRDAASAELAIESLTIVFDRLERD